MSGEIPGFQSGLLTSQLEILAPWSCLSDIFGQVNMSRCVFSSLYSWAMPISPGITCEHVTVNSHKLLFVHSPHREIIQKQLKWANYLPLRPTSFLSMNFTSSRSATRPAPVWFGSVCFGWAVWNYQQHYSRALEACFTHLTRIILLKFKSIYIKLYR